MTVVIPSGAVSLQKNRRKYVDVYNNKQSIFIGVDETRKKMFVLKSKPTKSATKNDIIYIPVNLAKVISQIFADYEVGGGLKVSFGEDEMNKEFSSLYEKLKLEVKIPKLMRKKSYVGYSVARVRNTKEDEITEDSLRVDIIPAKNYFPNANGINIGDEFMDLPAHYIASEVKEQIDDTTTETFCYVDSYIKNEEGRTYKKEKYKTDGFSNERLYSKNMGGFKLNNLVETMIEETQLKELPLFIFSNEIEDDEDDVVENNIFGQSDYRDIFELLQEYNDRITQISVEFIKHLESSMSIPHSLFKVLSQQKRLRKQKDENAEEEFLMDNIGKIFSHGAGEQPAHYITKDIQTEKAIEWLKQTIINIAISTFVPESLLGVKNDVQATATQIVYDGSKFHRKVISRQLQIKNELQRMFGYLMALLNDSEEVEYPDISFVLPLPKDIERDSRVYTTLVNSGLMSKKTAIQNVMDYDDERVEEEMELIEGEQQVNIAIEGTNLQPIE